MIAPYALEGVLANGKHALLAHVPPAFAPLVSAIITVVPLLVVFPSLFAITTLLERKGLGRMQNRYGPNRVGPMGLLQPAADGVKALIKEDLVPRTADALVHLLAPVMIVVSAFLAFAVLPLGRNMVVANLNSGILYFFAVGATVELAIFMAGWSSHSKYSMLGAMRAIAQMISYEVPLVLSSVVVLMTVGSLSPVEIVNAQARYIHTLPHWFVFTPWGFAGFLLFMVAATAESNRSPFDLPESESELVAGYFTEYSGFKFALFFLGEYLGMMATSGLAITLFLGGWSAPFSFLQWIPSFVWFFAKLVTLICVFIWIRGTLPRLRMDQLMGLAWKFMLPMALLNIITAGTWRFLPHGITRWAVCTVFVVAPWFLLARGLKREKKLQPRTYRFAE